MHILMTADTLGGVWQYSMNLCGLLSRQGYQITLVSLGELPNRSQLEQVKELQNVRLIPTRFGLEWMHEAWASVAESCRYVEALARELQVDLIHANQYCFGQLARSLSIPVIVVAHSDVLSWCAWCLYDGDLELTVDDDRLRYYMAVREGLQAADAIIAPSAFMQDMVRHFYRPERMVEVIYNGAAAPCLPCSPGDGDVPVVISVGRAWDIAKNVPLIEEAVERLPDDIAARFIIVGPRQHPEHGKAWPAQSDRIEYIDYLPHAELQLLLRQASIYIAASRYEPFGLTTLEAALAGCTLLANDTPFFRELWGARALYFERNSADDLAQKLVDLLSAPHHLNSASEQTRAHALESYSLEKQAAGYNRLYERMCKVQVEVDERYAGY